MLYACWIWSKPGRKFHEMVQSIPWVRKGLGCKMRRYNQQIHSILVEGPIEITRLHTRKAGETGLDGLNSSCFRSSGFTSNHHRSLLAGGVETGFRFTGSCIKLTYIHLHAIISLESGTFWYSEKKTVMGVKMRWRWVKKEKNTIWIWTRWITLFWAVHEAVRIPQMFASISFQLPFARHVGI